MNRFKEGDSVQVRADSPQGHARSRVVSEPRTVLTEFGTHIPDETEVRVHDSTADLRYIVIPMRPESTGDLSEDELAQLVTRDCMIGTAIPEGPEE